MAAQIGVIEDLQDYVQSVDLIDVTDDTSESTQTQPELDDGQQCKQCYENCADGRVDPSDGAHGWSRAKYLIQNNPLSELCLADFI